jgi:hypothetical protein
MVTASHKGNVERQTWGNNAHEHFVLNRKETDVNIVEDLANWSTA